MKKYLAAILAIVLTLSFFTFTVSAADDMEITPYAVACSACRNRMQAEEEDVVGAHFRVLSCSAYNWAHLHYDKYTQRNWVCTTNGCPAYGIKIPAGDPVYVGAACGLEGLN